MLDSAHVLFDSSDPLLEAAFEVIGASMGAGMQPRPDSVHTAMKKLLLLVALVVLVAACEDVPDLAGEDIVLRVDTSGGCAQMGPNCSRIEVWGDGTVRMYRLESDRPPHSRVDSGAIDPALVAKLHGEVSSTRLHQVLQRLPEGECRGCFDGIDTTMSLPYTAGGVQPVEPLAFSSVDVELDRSEPLLAAAWEVYEAALEVVEIPLVAR